MELHNLKPKKGSRRKHPRLGRGESSGHGKTSGKGGKGQTARTGGTIRPGFEGGQMPLYRRLPKLGFRSRQKAKGTNQYSVIGLDQLAKLASNAEITPELLLESGIISNSKNKAGVKLLANGSLDKKVSVKVHACSEAARTKIEALGGTVTLIEKKKKVTT